jgi:hypothetical protein
MRDPALQVMFSTWLIHLRLRGRFLPSLLRPCELLGIQQRLAGPQGVEVDVA